MSKKLQAQVESMQEQLIHSDKMATLGKMTAGVVHEINNPLGYLMSNVGILKEYVESLGKVRELQVQLYQACKKDSSLCKKVQEIEDLEAKEDVEYIFKDLARLAADSMKGVESLSAIVKGLRLFSRDDGRRTEEVDLNETLATSIQLARNELKYTCDVKTQFDPIPLVQVCPGKMNQVFLNLLINASQSMESQGEIHVHSHVTDQEVCISFQDNGSGIPQSELAQLFDPFFTTKKNGTGLGLAISSQIVKEYGGRIEVTSVLGQGSTFKVFLPKECNNQREEAQS